MTDKKSTGESGGNKGQSRPTVEKKSYTTPGSVQNSYRPTSEGGNGTPPRPKKD